MEMAWLDQPRAVREGEELDEAKLIAYLQEKLPEPIGPLTIEQFPSGHSNLTYLLRIGAKEYVLRRPPFGAKIKTAHDMGREFRILSHLIKVYEKVPRPLLYCEDEAVLGAPFYIMERVHGVILRKELPPGLIPPAPLMRRISEALIDNFVQIHSINYQQAGLGDMGKAAGYIARQVHGWTERYRNAATDDIPELEATARWLADNMPADIPATMIHNDYKYDNLVLDPTDFTRIIAVLDWEMATIGNPLMDLGTSLGYWIEPGDPDELQALRFGPTMLPGNLTRGELIERYAAQSGRDISDMLFYYVYALFKIAGIAQQIYHRYKTGFSRDKRFALMILGIHAIGKAAQRAIQTGNITVK
ncbi:MAG: phosphotransferase family protein [Acidobacteriota bacterium]